MNPCSGNVTIPVKVRFLSETCPPEKFNYATPGSAGIDLRACMTEAEVSIPPGGRYRFPTGIAVECTMPGVAGFVYSRSGLGTKDGLVVSQGVGVIDPDYRGEILVSLLNTSGQTRTVTQGQRIAQLVFQPIVRAEIVPQEELSDTARGAGGFGHTGASRFFVRPGGRCKVSVSARTCSSISMTSLSSQKIGSEYGLARRPGLPRIFGQRRD